MSAQRRFAVGDSYAVVGEAVVVMLPVAERARVATLWELSDAGASADAILDALVARGLSGLSDFALVSNVEGAFRVLVRGAATAFVRTEEGEQHISAAPGTAWHEQILTSATGARVSFGGEAAADHPLTPGLARVSAVEFGVLVPTESNAAVEEQAEPVAEEEIEPVAEVMPKVETDAEVVEPVIDWSDRDGQTVIGEPTSDFDRPPVLGQEIAPHVLSRPVASLVFSTGDVVEVDRTVLIGRAPEARQFASHDQPRVVTVSSPNHEISSTHLEIRPGAGADHGSAIATDLGSTNGTMLVQPGLAAEQLKAGIAVSLIPGAVLDLGDGVTIQVANP